MGLSPRLPANINGSPWPLARFASAHSLGSRAASEDGRPQPLVRGRHSRVNPINVDVKLSMVKLHPDDNRPARDCVNLEKRGGGASMPKTKQKFSISNGLFLKYILKFHSFFYVYICVC